MLDIGWSELLVIGIVALIVVGPKDLPMLFRRLGEFTGRARSMAREFSSAMDRAADEAGVRDVQKNFRDMADPKKMGLDALDDAAGDIARWNETGAAGTARPERPAKTAPAGSTPGSQPPGTKPVAAPGTDADTEAMAEAASPKDPAP